MADPFGTSHRSLEPDDVSSFLHNLIHDGGLFHRTAPEVDESVRRRNAGASDRLIESSPRLNFPDPSEFCRTRAREGAVNAFSLAGIEDYEAAGSSRRTDFEHLNKDREISDGPSNPAQPRSSKRCRSAEVHNLSEKRRRSRINEKLKALQTLIPNSNKTDKASMLDEAIEYLKQLQLQVQVLTMRNGPSMYPGYFQGSLQSVQLPNSEIEFGKGNGVAFSGNQEMLFQSNSHVSNHNPTTQHTMHSTKNNMANPENPGLLQTTIHNPYGLLNQLASTKDLCRDNALSRLHLDTSCSGNNSSSGISS
ncbi:unnamed protein product [Cuscuta campestris]|uniref:BHLH domain-containing protein n=1 Tax=Cuscuta campestris TaxID=132261 RepID=A0A484ME17_9ASTE|nr:unnamed protein product [Cuscuta campestris]